jgi:hypothetical protein
MTSLDRSHMCRNPFLDFFSCLHRCEEYGDKVHAQQRCVLRIVSISISKIETANCLTRMTLIRDDNSLAPNTFRTHTQTKKLPWIEYII